MIALCEYVVVAGNIIDGLNFLDVYYSRNYNLEKLNKSPPQKKKTQHHTQISDYKAFLLAPSGSFF